MTLQNKIRRTPLSHRQRQIRQDNIRRLREFKALPPEEKPAPEPRDCIADYKPTPIRVSLFDLTNTAPQENGPEENQHAPVPRNRIRPSRIA
jgi:hypothetical protein